MTSPVPVTSSGHAGVDDRQQGLQPPQRPVGSPILGQLRGGAGHVAGKVAQLGFEALQQGEGVGTAAGETGDDLAFKQPADFHRVGLHHGVAERHLAVAADGHPALVAHAQNGRGADFHGRRAGSCGAKERRFAATMLSDSPGAASLRARRGVELLRTATPRNSRAGSDSPEAASGAPGPGGLKQSVELLRNDFRVAAHGRGQSLIDEHLDVFF